jgi:hypothetical protein
MIAASIILLSSLAVISDAFYLPGVAPHSFQEGENVDLKVNKLRLFELRAVILFLIISFC